MRPRSMGRNRWVSQDISVTESDANVHGFGIRIWPDLGLYVGSLKRPGTRDLCVQTTDRNPARPSQLEIQGNNGFPTVTRISLHTPIRRSVHLRTLSNEIEGG